MAFADVTLWVKHSAPYAAWKEWRKSLIRQWHLQRYRGTTYRCPVCDTGLSAFQPIWRSFLRRTQEAGYVHPLSSIETFNYRAYTCPSCGSSDRERLYALYFERAFADFDPQRRYRMIDFAPPPALSRWLKRHPFLEHRSADLFRRSVDDKVDITAMPYADNSADVFLCSHVLEHVPDDRRAMRELARILKPDGFGIVMVPLVKGLDETQEGESDPQRRWALYCDSDHVRQYGRADFVSRLRAAGFDVEQVTASFFPPDALPKAGVLEDSVLYVVRKSGAPVNPIVE